MAWQDEMTTLLRVMVWDVITPQKYTDDTLQTVLVGSAQLVLGEVIGFKQTFVADVQGTDISPDPTDRSGGTRDDAFINLVAMKAAALVDQGIVRTESGIVIRDNGSMVDLSHKLSAALRLLENGWAKKYENERFLFSAGLLGNTPPGMGVVGAFRSIERALYGNCADDVMDVAFNPRSGNYY